MKPKILTPGQTDLLQPRLEDLLDMSHPIVQLADLIDWESVERDYADHFPSHTGRPATRARLAVGLLLLQHTYKLSDVSVLEQWLQNFYFQFFCGEEFIQHHLPVDPSSLSRWRKTLGRPGVSRLLAATIEAGERAGLVSRSSFEKVTVDTTVMHKNIAFPLDGELCDKARKRLLELARKGGIRPRRTYARLAGDLLGKAFRLGRSRRRDLMEEVLEKLRGFTGKVAADIRGQLVLVSCPSIRERIEAELAVTERLLKQRRGDSKKVYSIHEPHVDCISKGKARTPYEFGCKVSLAVTHREGFAVGVLALPGAPYDGHTLAEALEQVEDLTRVLPKFAFVDRGYRTHGVERTEVFMSGQKRGVTQALRKDIKRRAAIEPGIGHMKSDGRLARCPLKGIAGDMFHAVMCGCGHNIRMILRWIGEAAKNRRRLAMQTAPPTA